MGSRNLLKHGLEKNPVHNSFSFVLSISSPGICFRKRAWVVLCVSIKDIGVIQKICFHKYFSFNPAKSQVLMLRGRNSNILKRTAVSLV